MTEFVSEVKTILYSDADVYRVLSDLRKLDAVKDQISENNISDLSFDENRISFRLNPIGEVTFLVEEREPNKMVKFKSEKLPFDVFMWIQLVSKAEKEYPTASHRACRSESFHQRNGTKTNARDGG